MFPLSTTFNENKSNECKHTKLSHLALVTSSSSAKSHGPDYLVDGNPGTYWQSDGPLPHRINIKLGRQINIRGITIDISFMKDDSYAPMEIEVHAGTGSNDLKKISHEFALQKNGCFTLYAAANSKLLRPFSEFELVITGNNEGGRDTRIRGLEIYGAKKLEGPKCCSNLYYGHR